MVIGAQGADGHWTQTQTVEGRIVMKQLTKDEIKAGFIGIFPKADYSFEAIDIDVICNDGKSVIVEVWRMYESPSANEVMQKQVEEMFDTPNVEIISDIDESGCNTCDYGSRYGFILRVWQ
jgi:hypothetical protein